MFVIINHCKKKLIPHSCSAFLFVSLSACPLMAHKKKSVTSQKKNIPKAITKETLGVMTIKITVTMAGSVEDK